MKKAVNLDSLYLELPFEERFAAAAKDGFRYVEMWYHHGRSLARIKEELERNHLRFSGMNGDRYFAMCDPDHKTEYVQEVRETLLAAKELGMPGVALHSNVIAEDGRAADTFPQYSALVKNLTMYDNLKTLAPIAEDMGMMLVIEPLNTVVDHFGNFLADTQSGAELTAAVGSPNVKVLYDAYHMYLNEGRVCETLKTYADQIGYVHIADAPGRHEPGTGAIHYPRVFRTLKELGFKGFVSFELFAETTTSAAIPKIMAACGDYFEE